MGAVPAIGIAVGREARAFKHSLAPAVIDAEGDDTVNAGAMWEEAVILPVAVW